MDQPVAHFVGLGCIRGASPASYYREAAATDAARLSTTFTAVTWFHVRHIEPTFSRRVWDSQRSNEDGFAFAALHSSLRFDVTTPAGTAVVSVGTPVVPGPYAMLGSWDGATVRTRAYKLGSNSLAHGGVPNGNPQPLSAGVFAASVGIVSSDFRIGSIGGLIVQRAFRIAPADEVDYLDAVVDALQQGRDVPRPDPTSGGFYWDARDLFTSVGSPPPAKWNDRIGGVVLTRAGAPELRDIAARF